MTGGDPTGSLVRPVGDFFATSPAATEALLEVESICGTVWEPGRVAIFARLALLEGRARRNRLWGPHPPARVWVFPSRPALARNGGPYQTGLIAFSWYVWQAGHVGPPQLGWLS